METPLAAVLDKVAVMPVVREGSLRREIAWRRPDRTELWLDAQFFVLTDLEGCPAHILMCGSDITRRRAVAASAAAMNEMMAQLTGVMETLSGLARQINLLALNAAIEAARAHKAGLGFAVVSQEIRTLSVEAAKSVEQINGLVQESRNQISAMAASGYPAPAPEALRQRLAARVV